MYLVGSANREFLLIYTHRGWVSPGGKTPDQYPSRMRVLGEFLLDNATLRREAEKTPLTKAGFSTLSLCATLVTFRSVYMLYRIGQKYSEYSKRLR